MFNKVWKPALNEKLDCYHKFENNCDLFNQNVQIRWRCSTSFVATTRHERVSTFQAGAYEKNVKRLSVKSTKK